MIQINVNGAKMKIFFIIILLLAYCFSLYSQDTFLFDKEDIVKIPQELSHKIFSGYLIRNIGHKIHNLKKGESTYENENIIAILYFEDYPSKEILAKFEKHGVEFYLDSWIPPLDNHPNGFFIAKVPVEKFLNILIYDELKLIASGEKKIYAQNNRGYKAINADDVWTAGWDGTGVKVAILDSGLDSFYDGTDIPATYDKKDYSAYPTNLDDDVENTVTGHGTHVTGSVLGRGSLSSSNTGNGGGAYKGMAPNADLCFLKIGSDASGGASNAAINGALNAAVSTYSADVITMSYGGCSTYHDGSDDMCQAADWCYAQGVPVFMSAGNDANDDHHFSGTVNANSETGYIQVTHNTSNRCIGFNLVWDDGIGRNIDLDILYYDSGYNPITKYQYSFTESSRGTESRQTDTYNTQSAGTYYVTVTNTSGSSQFFHLYELYGDGRSEFPSGIADPFYTCGSPAEADNVFAVGAWTTDRSWTAYNGTGYYFSSETNNDICTFSNRGPRIDGIQKPQLTAPGASVISIRDTDFYTSANAYWVDNNGDTTAPHNYYVMLGTSMSCPMVAGAAALILDRWPNVSPQQVYDALQINALKDGYTGGVPNSTWGYGKLDVQAAINDEATLPVILSTFTAQFIENTPTIYWETQSETDNMGWFVYRNDEENFTTSEKISEFIEGHGTTTQQQSYLYKDDIQNPEVGDTYYYWLESIDYSGIINHYDKVAVLTIPDQHDPGGGLVPVPEIFGLLQNEPNPFIESTKISFNLRETSQVRLNIYNLKGQLVKLLYSGVTSKRTIMWDGKDDNDNELQAGVYLYKLFVNGKTAETKKLIFIK